MSHCSNSTHEQNPRIGVASERHAAKTDIGTHSHDLQYVDVYSWKDVAFFRAITLCLPEIKAQTSLEMQHDMDGVKIVPAHLSVLI